jgi:hypothetical protein
MLASMKTIQRVVIMAFRRGVYPHDFASEKDAIMVSKQAISTAHNTARDELAKFFGPRALDAEQDNGGASELFLAVISLLQVFKFC